MDGSDLICWRPNRMKSLTLLWIKRNFFCPIAFELITVLFCFVLFCFLWREWCWSWNSNTLATSCEELSHWKSLWCWEGLGAGGEGDDRGWGGWMASRTRWRWVWVNSRSWWLTGRPGVLQFMGSQRVGYDWATELNWIREIIQLDKWKERKTEEKNIMSPKLELILLH